MNVNLRQIEVLAPQSRPDGNRSRKRGFEADVYKRGADLKLQVAALEQQRQDHIDTINRLTARLGDGGLESGAAALERENTGQRLQAGIDQRDQWIGDWRNHCTSLQQEKAADALAYAESCQRLGASLAAATDNCTALATQLLAATDQATAATNERVSIDKELTAQMLKCSHADEHIRRANSAYRVIQGELHTARNSILRLTGQLEQANRQVIIYPALTAIDGPGQREQAGQLEQANRPVSISPALATVEGPTPATGPLAGPGPALTDDGPADFGRPPLDSVPPQLPLRIDAVLFGPALPGTARLGPALPGPGTASMLRAPSPAGLAGARPPRSPSASPDAVSGRFSLSPARSRSTDSRPTPPSPVDSPQSFAGRYHGLSPDPRTSSPEFPRRRLSSSPLASSSSGTGPE